MQLYLNLGTMGNLGNFFLQCISLFMCFLYIPKNNMFIHRIQLYIIYVCLSLLPRSFLSLCCLSVHLSICISSYLILYMPSYLPLSLIYLFSHFRKTPTTALSLFVPVSLPMSLSLSLSLPVLYFDCLNVCLPNNLSTVKKN